MPTAFSAKLADVLLVKTGAVVSITIFLLAPSELAAPGEAKVSTALFKATSRMVPLFRVSAVVPV